MATKKTSKNAQTDPFAPVRDTILEAVNTAKSQQEQFAGVAQAETEKARTQAAEGFDKAIETYRENFEAAVMAVKTAADNMSKIEELTRAKATEIAEGRVEGAVKVLSAKDPAEFIKLQVELMTAEQKKAQEMAKEAVALYEGMAKQIFGPMQAQMAKSFEQAAKFGKAA